MRKVWSMRQYALGSWRVMFVIPRGSLYHTRRGCDIETVVKGAIDSIMLTWGNIWIQQVLYNFVDETASHSGRKCHERGS